MNFRCPSGLPFFVQGSTTEEEFDWRMSMIDRIYDEQFDLSYYVKGVSIRDTDFMTIKERQEFYSRLLKVKEQEREAMKKSLEG